MSNLSYYMISLASLPGPATVREIHQRAKELYGEAIRGERSSAKGSLERYVLLGKVVKVGKDRYWLTEKATDPLIDLTRKLKEAEEQVETLKKHIRELEDSMSH